MSSKYSTGAEDARAPRAIWGYLSRNHEASTVNKLKDYSCGLTSSTYTIPPTLGYS